MAIADDVEGFGMAIRTLASHLLIQSIFLYCDDSFKFTANFSVSSSVVVMARFFRALLRLSRIAIYLLPTRPPTLSP